MGGVAEVRSAITKYEEKSPLYGLVQFRRKKVILKYVPDGTSRLLQVRLTVQFQSVLETFVPHDTVLSFAAPSELTESALTSACMLHPSSMSLTSSSSSLRRQPLGEISEDAEESPHIRGQSKSRVAATPAQSATDVTQESQKEPVSITVYEPVLEKVQPLPTRDPQEVVPPATEKKTSVVQSPSASTTRASSITPTPTIAHTTGKALPTTPERTPPNSSDGRGTSLPAPHTIPELPPIQQVSHTYRIEDTEPRESFQSNRPSVTDAGRPSFSNYDSYDPFKPKVKRGPRPHVEPDTRPQTAGSTKKPQVQRLVANLPTSVRTQNRTAGTNTGRPGSQQSSRSVPSKFAHYPEQTVLPPLPSPNHISSLFLPKTPHDRAFSKAGSFTTTATVAATPEKLRLMKALQLRKRNQQQAKRESEQQPRTEDEPKTSSRSQVAADVESLPSQAAVANSGGDSTSASRIEDAVKAKDAERMASPTSMTNVSEVPSTQSSSFVEDNDGTISHGSISSDTSSSVTPKADTRGTQQRKQTESPVPVPAREIGGSGAPPGNAAPNAINLSVGAENVQEAVTSSKIMGQAASGPEEHRVLASPDEQVVKTAAAGLVMATESGVNTANHAAKSGAIEEDVRPPVPSKSRDGEIRRKRGTDLEPIKVLSSPDLSEASDDDSFMEELQHAQLQQAKPVAVGRSPVTPIYHNLNSSVDRPKEISRAVSSPLNDTNNSTFGSPSQSRPHSIRSISTALPSWPPSNENIPPVPLAKKGPLSSGISKRIKALEVFTSGRESSSSPPQPPPNNTLAQNSKAALTSSRKRLSFISGGNTPNASTRTPAPALFSTPEQAIEKERTDYEQSKLSSQRQIPAVDPYQHQQKGETISVTARIVRNPSMIHEDSATAADALQQVPLQRSKLTIEHGRTDLRENGPTMTRDSSTLSNEGSTKSPQAERARPSFSSYRSDSQVRLPTSDSMGSRMSMVSSRKKDKASLPRSNSDNSSFTEDRSKQSRARRLMQRVSNLSTSSRRNIVGAFSTNSKDQVTSDRISERAESDHDLLSVAESVSHVVDIGDVNVQFPDTLLWKRRFLRIDDQGCLIFTPPTMERNTRNISRKFHLSEFKKPTLPDVEREEMAWSILLDLEDGSCIQCACESKYTQTQVLRSKSRCLSLLWISLTIHPVLVDAHSAYHQLYSA